MSLKASQNAKNIGARFRSARSLVPNLNRKSFCERHEINRYTMQSWENGLHVSKGKNVEKFVEALAREGIACSSEWLIDGIGEPARPMSDQKLLEPVPTKRVDFSSALVCAYEQAGIELACCEILDDSMAPRFYTGDKVFGVAISDNIAEAHQKYCIVDLGERKLVRKLVYFKENILLLAEDSRIVSLKLGPNMCVFEIIWHSLRQ